MRQILLVLLTGLLMMPWYAQARTESKIVSSGSHQTALVQQDQALDSRVDIHQIGALSRVVVVQTSRNNEALVRTQGTDQRHTVEQHGYGRNFLNLTSLGTANISTVLQYGYYGGGNEANLMQDGVSNAAMIQQQGSNLASLIQAGTDNVGNLVQTGWANRLSLVQSGDGNTADLSQTGGGLEMSIEQTGGAEIAIHQTN